MGQMLRPTVFDEFGLSRNPDDWTPEAARELAERYDMGKLSDEHWAFIDSLRDYYQQFHVPPPSHNLCQGLHLQRGCGHILFHSCLDCMAHRGLTRRR